MDYSTSDYVRAQALWLALETFPDDALGELADGEEQAVQTLMEYAKAILRHRRMASNAKDN